MEYLFHPYPVLINRACLFVFKRMEAIVQYRNSYNRGGPISHVKIFQDAVRGREDIFHTAPGCLR